jgi:hypothetical protein
MSGGDIGSASSHKWLLLYIGGSIGTPSGLLYNTQQPALPFNAKYHIQWRTDWSSPNMKNYEGGSWSDMVFSGSLVLNGNFVEMRIPLADIGSPSTILNIHLSCIYDLSSNEVTYAGVPFNSFIDGFDPNYTHYYSFNLAGSISPSSYSPI